MYIRAYIYTFHYKMSLKIDSIPVLAGSINYPEWEQQIRRFLQSEDLYSHVEGDEDDPNAPWPASYPPVLPDNPTAARRTEFRNWWKDDARTMLIIERRITQVQLGLLPSEPGTTARHCWNKLRNLYGRLDVHAQFALMDKVSNLRLKDHTDCDRYLSEFSLARGQFAKMGVDYTELQAVHALIKGLPMYGSWISFTQITNTYVGEWVRSEARKNPEDREAENALWENLVSRLTQECLHLATTANRFESRKKTGPASEYAGFSSNDTGFRKTRHNPNGVRCTNCRRVNHDVEHCFAPNGGMAGLRDAYLNRTGQFARPENKSEGTPVVAAFSSANDVHAANDVHDFSFASIEQILTPEEFACIVNTNFSTLLDSGASSHIIKDASYFWTYNRQGAKSVRTANHGTLSTLASGDCVALVRCGQLSTRITLRNCFHAPSAVINLLSVGKIVSAGFRCNFENNEVVISAPGPEKRNLCEGPMLNNLFFLDIEYLTPPSNRRAAQIPRSHHFSNSLVPSTPPASTTKPLTVADDDTICFAKVPVDANLWHARMGHVGEKATIRILNSTTGASFPDGTELIKCEPCIIGKHHDISYPATNSPPPDDFLELVLCDICGPFPVQTPHKKLYFIIFLDVKSKFNELHNLATHDQALDAFLITKNRWELQLGKKIKCFRADGAGELGAPFNKVLQEAGIQRQLTVAHSHQQGGEIERLMRTLQGRMLAMLTWAKLPLTYWGEAALTASYLMNLTLQSSLPNNVTPYEMFYKKKPNISHLRVFGARAFAHVPLELQTKLGIKSRECLFMGYPPGQKGYRVRDVSTGTFFTATAVIFDENSPYHPLHDTSQSNPLSSGDTIPAPIPTPLPGTPRRSSRPVRLTAAGEAQAARIAAAKMHLADVREIARQRAEHAQLTNGDVLMPLADLDDDTIVTGLTSDAEDIIFSATSLPSVDEDELALISIRSSERRSPSSSEYDLTIPPYNYNEAMRRPDRDVWQATIDKELLMFNTMKIFREEVLPQGRFAIGSTWVFEYKLVDSLPPLAKGRLCARGYSQIPNVDFTETFAPVVKTTSVRIVAALAAKLDLYLECFDATRAFLWSDLHETIYMKYPQGYQGTPGMVWRLLKSLYGLKQASLMWYRLFKATLENLGFTRSEFDHGLFVFRRIFEGSNVICFLAVHVDDGLGATNSSTFFTHLKDQIAKAFGIKDLGPATNFVGFQFERDRASRRIWLHQENFINNLLDEYSLHDCNSVSTPLDSNLPLGNEDLVYPDVPNLTKSFQRLIGSLLFLSICTRPDISFAVMTLSQWNSKPQPRHFAAAKRILRYLKGTKGLRLKYGGVNDHPLHGFIDSDWGG